MIKRQLKHREKNIRTPFPSHIITINGIKIHYLDEGEKNWPVILLLHGIPTWSYTFRNIIPTLKEEKIRCIAPDLPGFGNSECMDSGSYTLKNHRDLIIDFLKQFKINEFYVYGNDWGTVISLLLMADNSVNIKGTVVSNGYLPVIGQNIPVHFRMWMWFTRFSPVLPISCIINAGTKTTLSQISKKMFDAPFKNNRKTAVRRLPNILPVRTWHREAKFVETTWEKLKDTNTPLLTVFSTNDPYTSEGAKLLQQTIPGAAEQLHLKLDAKHFITEDAPGPLAQSIVGFVRKYQNDI